MSSTTPHTSRNQFQPDDEIDIGRIFSILWLNKIWIGLSLLLGLVLGGLYAFTTKPVYQADALLQIESKSKSQILGDLADLTAANMGNNEASTEVHIVRSRMVLGSTVDTLTLTARPHYVSPGFFKRLFGEAGAILPVMKMAQFIVPVRYLGEEFVLIYRDQGKYEIQTPFGKTYAAKIGEPFTSQEGIVSMVSSIDHAVAGDSFVIRPVSRQMAMRTLATSLNAQENGKKTNILSLSVNDQDPRQAETVLNTVVDFYTKQNREYDAQVAASSLNFIKQQLPVIRQDLERAENALNAFRHRNASVDIATESKGLVESLSQIEMQLTDLKVKESDIAQLYTPEHPMYKAIAEKKSVLERAKKQMLARVSNLPATQQDMIRLKREVDTQQTVYLQLLQKQQELSITQASKLGNIRVIDRAMAQEQPIKPRKDMILLATTVGLGMLTTLFFILRALFRRGIDDVDSLESIGTPVLASVPFSEVQRKRDKVLRYLKKRNTNARSNFLLAHSKSEDSAVEALRALRTSLFLHVMEARNNIIMVTGPTPHVGKTFVSANLATVLTQADKKVLLIDADMRKGYLHEMFDQDVGTGLSDWLQGKTQQTPIRQTPVNALDLVSHGSHVDSPAELLSLPRFAAMLQEVSQAYDFVIVDAPPVLAVTDANIIGQHAGTTLLVTRFEETTIRDVEATISRLHNTNIDIAGAVLNGIQRTASNYYSYDAYTSYTKKSA